MAMQIEWGCRLVSYNTTNPLSVVTDRHKQTLLDSITSCPVHEIIPYLAWLIFDFQYKIVAVDGYHLFQLFLIMTWYFLIHHFKLVLILYLLTPIPKALVVTILLLFSIWEWLLVSELRWASSIANTPSHAILRLYNSFWHHMYTTQILCFWGLKH